MASTVFNDGQTVVKAAWLNDVNAVVYSGAIGTVSSVAVNTVNGFTGVVATPNTTPTITLGTNLTGLLKGNGVAMFVAVAGTDYSLGTAVNATGLVKSTTTTGALTTALSGTDYAPATTGSSLLYGNAAGGFSNATIGANLTFVGGSLAATNSGTVTSASVVTANGVSGTVATATTTPAITLTLGAITPTTVVASGAVSGTNLSGTNTGDETLATIKSKLGVTTLSGSNTGDQTITLTGDATGSGIGSFPVTLANTTATPGSYTNANITVNAKGLITTVASGAAGGTGTVTSVSQTVPAFLSIAGSPITTTGTLAITLSGTALPVLNGGTGATTAPAALTSLGAQAALVSGTSIKTINSVSLLGSGDVAVGYLNIPQNSQSVAYTTVLADQGKHLLHPSADTTARTFTIDANATIAYQIGTAITFINQNAAGVLTIAITTDTMRLAGAGTTGSRTLAANGIATAVKVTTTEWIISGTGLT